jgi:hypothetical protein
MAAQFAAIHPMERAAPVGVAAAAKALHWILLLLLLLQHLPATLPLLMIAAGPTPDALKQQQQPRPPLASAMQQLLVWLPAASLPRYALLLLPAAAGEMLLHSQSYNVTRAALNPGSLYHPHHLPAAAAAGTLCILLLLYHHYCLQPHPGLQLQKPHCCPAAICLASVP